jgi:cell wall-associated NlpC family hydrolase
MAHLTALQWVDRLFGEMVETRPVPTFVHERIEPASRAAPLEALSWFAATPRANPPPARASMARPAGTEQGVLMVVRLALGTLAIASLVTLVTPLAAQPLQPASLTASTDAYAPPTFAGSTGADPSNIAESSDLTPAGALDEFEDPGQHHGSAASPAAASPAAPPATASAAPTTTAGKASTTAEATDKGEFGVEYELSARGPSLLDRLTLQVKHLVQQAMTYIGTPYRRGGSSRRGLDCSGLVGAVYSEAGVELPRTAAEQFARGVPVAAANLQPGDLVFFRDTYKHGISHVGIYVGDDRFIHAAGRHQGVIVSDLSGRYYQLRFAGARRLTSLAPAPSATAASSGGSVLAPAGQTTGGEPVEPAPVESVAIASSSSSLR